MAVVVFNSAQFIALYPEFAAVDPARLGAFFMRAGLYLDNTDCSIVQDIPKRTMLLYLITAHIGQLLGALSAGGAAVPSGQVLSATEGSVTVSFANLAPGAGSAAWWASTPYGLEFWAATAYLRSFRYAAGPPLPLNGNRWGLPWRN